jgi:Tol biopolymer transport system component
LADTQTPAVNDVAAEFWAEFSPDGKSLAYQSVNQPDRPFRGSVKTIALSSVDPIVISQEGFAPAWSNNGEWVAYFKRSDAGVSIWRARSSGGDAQKIADGAVTPPGYLATPYLKIGSSHISWAPDDSRIAYAARVDGRSNIWLVNADGSRNSAITSNSEMGDTYCFPMWSPDGRSLVYVSERGRSAGSANGEYRLIYFDLQTAEPHSVFDSPERFRFLGLSDGGKNALIAKRSDPKDSPIVPEATDIY